MQTSHTAHIKSLNCRNCNTPAPGKFCPQCGQDTAPHPPSALEFIHEFASHYIAFEGKLWRTLGLLFFKPGQLTKEYLVGRKQRYVLPLRLYLTISLIFFIALSISVNINTQVGVNEKQMKEEMSKNPRITIGAMSEGDGYYGARLEKDGTFNCKFPTWICDRLRAKIDSVKASPSVVVSGWITKFRDDWPYAMFLLMPVFALLMMLAYWRRRMVYGEHLVFAFHVHAAWFVLAFLTLFLPESINGLPLIVMPAYTLMAMQRVYRGRWWLTLLRGSILAAPYLMAVFIVMVLLGFYIVLA